MTIHPSDPIVTEVYNPEVLNECGPSVYVIRTAVAVVNENSAKLTYSLLASEPIRSAVAIRLNLIDWTFVLNFDNTK